MAKQAGDHDDADDESKNHNSAEKSGNGKKGFEKSRKAGPQRVDLTEIKGFRR